MDFNQFVEGILAVWTVVLIWASVRLVRLAKQVEADRQGIRRWIDRDNQTNRERF